MSRRPAAIKTKFSAGGVVYSISEGRISVVLIKPANGNVFSLPKGEVIEGETPEEAALREVKEETGLDAAITDDLGSVTYWFFLKGENIKYKKTVRFFLMVLKGGSTEDHDSEVSEVIWEEIDRAAAKVTYRTDIQVLGKARKLLMEKKWAQ